MIEKRVLLNALLQPFGTEVCLIGKAGVTFWECRFFIPILKA